MNKIKIIGPFQYSEQDLLGSGSTGHVFKGVLKANSPKPQNPSASTIPEPHQTTPQILVAIKVIPHTYISQN